MRLPETPVVDSFRSPLLFCLLFQKGVLVHELGHNFGLAHSGGLDGKTYTDHTGMMGNPLYSDDVGRMCYNAAKSWQIGWYDDRKIQLNPLDQPSDWSETIAMVGVADYLNSQPKNERKRPNLSRTREGGASEQTRLVTS